MIGLTNHGAAAIWRLVAGVLLFMRLAVAAKPENESMAFLSRIKRIPDLVGVDVNCQICGAT